MIESIINHFDKIAGVILTGVFGGYVALHVFKAKKRIETGKELITAFDDAIRSVKEWDTQLIHILNRTLTEEFIKQRKAAHEFQRHLGFFARRGFDKAWKEYHGNNEDNPNFMQYLMPETWPDLFLNRVNKILKYAKKT